MKNMSKRPLDHTDKTLSFVSGTLHYRTSYSPVTVLAINWGLQGEKAKTDVMPRFCTIKVNSDLRNQIV